MSRDRRHARRPLSHMSPRPHSHAGAWDASRSSSALRPHSGAALALWRPLSSTAPRPLVRSVIPIAPAEELAWGNRPHVAISPDGGRVAFSGTQTGRRQIYLRALDRPEAEPIPGTENGTQPFFSRDGEWLGFWAEGASRKSR